MWTHACPRIPIKLLNFDPLTLLKDGCIDQDELFEPDFLHPWMKKKNQVLTKRQMFFQKLLSIKLNLKKSV